MAGDLRSASFLPALEEAIFMSHEMTLFVFSRIVGIGAMIVAMGFLVDRYLTIRHYKRCNG
jgi:hypothetical protein